MTQRHRVAYAESLLMKPGVHSVKRLCAVVALYSAKIYLYARRYCPYPDDETVP